MSRLARYFQGVAVKRLSEVEADPDTSNQHEFNGIAQMSDIFGTERIRMDANFVYLTDEEEETLKANAFLTWYDARERHPVRTEYRMYFPTNEVMTAAAGGDLLVIARKPDGTVLAVIVRQGSTVERQILWLFGIMERPRGFSSQTIENGANREVNFAELAILETIGVEAEPEEAAPGWLEQIEARFGLAGFPKTRDFSAFARETLPDVSAREDPDAAIYGWVNHEEMLFRTLERHIVEKRLEQGFNKDVDVFLKFSLSVQNRRKSRMGHALEHHLRQVFNDNALRFEEQVVTEQNSKPDFLFPGLAQYRDEDLDVGKLTMLGAKSSCKERWNQVLAEANRIDDKHLFTLEPSISPGQTEKMRDKRLQLILPASLHETYLPEQQEWLMDLTGFVAMVKDRQAYYS
jgi:hypothetical protein